MRIIETFGTSVSSAVVSGLAALIWTYYPNLTSEELEFILKKSGTAYDITVETKEFKNLSQNGKVINAHRAILMANKLSTEKLNN